MTHNNIRDNLLCEVCHDVKVEPQLQKVNEGDCLNPKTLTGDQARLDVSARGVWTPFDKTFLYIRVSHLNSQLLIKQDQNSSRSIRREREGEEG